MSKIITREQAAEMVKDGMTIGIGGFVGFGLPEDLLIALQNRYIETKFPKDLTAFHCAGIGDGKERGANHLGEEGLVKKLVCAHIGLEPRLNKLAVENKLAAYMIPQGVTSQMLRAIAGKKPGVLTHVGLKTFADPRLEGCKANQAAVDSGEEVVSLVNIEGKDYLLYKSFPIDICFIKGSIGDESGNISLCKEAVFSDQLEMAAAVHNSGGIVIAQVDQIVAKGTLKAHDVKVHGFMVDYIVEGNRENSF
ncbi:MAG: CoA-transferase, partial [Clostridium sp.]|nr:CoA-transferase [Clostridium sp.]